MANRAFAALNSPRDNRLLADLPKDRYDALVPSLEPLKMPLGDSLYESGGTQGYVYFPTSAIVSLLYVLEDGHSAEIAVTGNDGLVGIALFMGGETTPSRAVVQSAGEGYRLRASVLKKYCCRASDRGFAAAPAPSPLHPAGGNPRTSPLRAAAA